MHRSTVYRSNLRNLLNQYEKQLAEYPNSSAETDKALLAILLLRDEIYYELQSTVPAAEELIQLDLLDSKLKVHQAITQRFNKIRKYQLLIPRHRKSQAWWWALTDTKSSTWNWLWSVASIVFLSVSVSLVLNTASRFWVSGVASKGTLVIVIQSVLTLLAGQGALTESGKKGWEIFLTRCNVPKKAWQQWSCAAAGCVLLIVAGIHSTLPTVATLYNERGWKSYQSKKLGSALQNYDTALSLRPDYPEVRFHNGLVHEDLQSYEQAKTNYQFVVSSDPTEVPLDVWLSAHNNLARLHLLSGNYRDAAPLIITAMSRLDVEIVESEQEIAEVNYNLLKNLAWVRLRQERYREAKVSLEEAIFLDEEVLGENGISEKAAAHCLLAQVLDAQKLTLEADISWENCLLNANLGNSDEDMWIGIYELRERTSAEQ